LPVCALWPLCGEIDPRISVDAGFTRGGRLFCRPDKNGFASRRPTPSVVAPWPPPKKSALPFLRWLLLLPLPLLWCVADHYGRLDFLENKTVELAFRSRGEIAAPVKIVYADVDSISLEELGNVPWKS